MGVGHLARLMSSRLKERNPSYGVTSKDVLCVTLAGLMHDMGHGPFSHLYELFREEMAHELKRFPDKRALYTNFPPLDDSWTHERSSIMMVDEVLREVGLAIDMRKENLDKPLKQIGDGIDAETIRCVWDESDSQDEILTNRDWIFIKECIYGEPLPEVISVFGVNELIGRPDPKKEWLYDIVANKKNGIDVDKMDYFARDQRKALSEAGNVDTFTIINEACIAKATCNDANCAQCKNGDYHFQICYPEKCVSRVIEFFKTRGKLHEFIYQHKTQHAAQCMLLDILKLADPYYLLETDTTGVALPISRAYTNAHAFQKMTDSIIDDIWRSKDPQLAPARALVEKYKKRKLYSKFRHHAPTIVPSMISLSFLPCR